MLGVKLVVCKYAFMHLHSLIYLLPIINVNVKNATGYTYWYAKKP